MCSNAAHCDRNASIRVPLAAHRHDRRARRRLPEAAGEGRGHGGRTDGGLGPDPRPRRPRRHLRPARETRADALQPPGRPAVGTSVRRPLPVGRGFAGERRPVPVGAGGFGVGGFGVGRRPVPVAAAATRGWKTTSPVAATGTPDGRRQSVAARPGGPGGRRVPHPAPACRRRWQGGRRRSAQRVDPHDGTRQARAVCGDRTGR